MKTTTRRQFITTLAGSTATLAFARTAAGADVIRVGLIVPGGHFATAAVTSGALLGQSEAEWTAKLMKRGFQLSLAEVSGVAEAVAEAERMRRSGIDVIAGGVSAEFCDALADAIPASFLEIRDRREVRVDDRKRRKHLRITPSHADYARALFREMKQEGLSSAAFVDTADQTAMRIAREEGVREVSREKAHFIYTDQPSEDHRRLRAGVSLPLSGKTAAPLAWHSDLYRYGAGEINERYVDATGAEMTESSWFGWVAMKLVLETALRHQRLADAKIDGHKGVPLTFRNGVLQQPLYVALHRGDRMKVLNA
ncbi:MAG: hypothetical protein KY432_10365 [Acidobacteria bacterium]|nr:hypothetical protein [Acidobacteriota bacterium]